jgi:hypothetical protein
MTPIRATIAILTLCLALALAPGAAASSKQLALIQDGPAFVEGHVGDPFERLAEARLELGADIVRANLYWRDVSPRPTANRKPGGFEVGDPASPGYAWGKYDRFVANANRLGFRVYITISGPIPHWGSTEPRRCDGDESCTWKPDYDLFGLFAKAVARRYRGRVRYWSIWNEPNIAGWLSPQYTHGGRVRYAARMYRALWWRGYKAIRRYDPARRHSVLFGELAPFASPRPFFRWSLCLNPGGRPIVSRRRGCPRRRPVRFPIAAVAHHPYPHGGVANPRSRVPNESNITIAYLHNLERAMDLAAKYRRMPRGRPLFITEYGIQTDPPDRFGVSQRRQARWLNESARLVFSDPRVWSTGQYELVDPKPADVFNMGLRFADDTPKAAWKAFRLPLVATEYERRTVEAWGWVRPGSGRRRVEVLARRRGHHRYRVIEVATTNPRGVFRIRHRGRMAADLVYRLRYRAPNGETWYSRRAYAGKPLRYRG